MTDMEFQDHQDMLHHNNCSPQFLRGVANGLNSASASINGTPRKYQENTNQNAVSMRLHNNARHRQYLLENGFDQDCSVGQAATRRPHTSFAVDGARTPRVQELGRDILWFHVTIVYSEVYTRLWYKSYCLTIYF